jgi:hypothetical protein
VWRPLMQLLQGACDDVLTVASSTLCNLLLEFSPSKEPILESGAVDLLCGLTRRQDPALRLNGILALMVMVMVMVITTALCVPPPSHLTTCTPTKSILYFDTVTSEPSLCTLLYVPCTESRVHIPSVRLFIQRIRPTARLL